MPSLRIPARLIQARSGESSAARWLATAILLLCSLLTPAAAWAAPPAKAPLAPRAQQTAVRWVDGLLGSEVMPDPNDPDETVPSNCTLEIIPPNTEDDDEENDTEQYVYHSCPSLTYALSIANPGDIIRVAGGIPNPQNPNGPPLQPPITYDEDIVIDKDITIIGGYQSGFGPVHDPPRFASLPTTINGKVTIQGVARTPMIPPSVSGEGPMEVRLETLGVSGGGIEIKSQGKTVGPLTWHPNTVNVTLDGVTVSDVNNGSGIRLTGANNKLTVTKSTISDNESNTNGAGLIAEAGTIVKLDAGTIVSNNHANGSANGGGIAAINALTITVSGGVTITGNTAAGGNGGGIYASGSILNVGSGTIISENDAASGAGIYLDGGTNSISGAEILSNTATSQGGGLYVKNTAKLENLEIKGNSAARGGGVYLDQFTGGSLISSDLIANTASSDGGGGYVTGANNATIQSNDFINNKAEEGNGGGLFVINSGIRLQSNTYSTNKAKSGGGLYLKSSNNAVTSGNTFDNNTADLGGGIYLTGNNGSKFSGLELITNVADQQGGGIYATSNPNITIGSATLQGNTSEDDGAGIYAIDSTLVFTGSALFDGNIAQGEGGGGYVGAGSQLEFRTLDLQDNEGSAGGGFYSDGGGIVATSATSFVGNKATSGTGGALYLKGSGSTVAEIANLFAQNNEAANGGAFYADGFELTLGVVNLTGNAAKNGSGGGAYFTNSTVTVTGTATFLENEASQHGGGIYASATDITFLNSPTFNGNEAKGGNGGGAYLTGTTSNSAVFGAATFFENIASENGGGLYVENVAASVTSGARFESNIAQFKSGGGYYITGSNLALGGITFQSNRAFEHGGGGYLTGGSLTLFAGTKFDDNRAQTGSGGGLAVADGTNVLVDDSLFSNNIANSDGGALHITNSPLVVQNGTTFDTNSATAGHGGAIYVSGGNATLNNLTFSKNKAGNGGGALHITTGNLSLQNSTFSENDGGNTTGSGGAGYLKANSATLTNNSFHKNLANSGGGLYIADTPSANLATLQFTENSSSGPGGGLYLHNSRAGLNTSNLRGNQASDEGGAIYALFSRVGVTNTLITGNKVTNVANYAAGVYLGNSEFHATHVTLANNTHQQLQGSAHAFYAAPPVAAPGGAPTQSNLTLINTIVSGQAVGVNLLAGNQATFNAVLWNNDHFNWTGAGAFNVTRSRRGDPRFVAAATNDFRLRRDSAAFDQGVTTSVSVDRDGVARKQGLAPDLGAYEHRYNNGLYLTTSVSPIFVQTGETLTIRLRVLNQSAATANNVILRATLPAQLPTPSIAAAPGAASQQCQGIFCEITWNSLAPGADVTVEINAGVSGTPLSTGLLNLLTNVTLATANFTTSDTSATVSAYLHSCRVERNGTIYHTLQEAMDSAANGQVIRISGVCGDMHQNGGPGQLLTIKHDVTLQGGWDSSFTTHNPADFPTILDAASLGRVIYLDGNVSPTFENLTIRNGSASALGGGPAGKDAGGGVYIKGGTPRFENVDIANNQSPDLGGGVYLASPNVINFTGGFVRNNIAGERGGGLYIDQSAPVLTGVNIAGNSARGGGGVYLYRSPAQFIDNAAAGSAPTCRIDTNTSSVMPNYVPGPGSGLPVLWLAPGGGGGIVLDESAATIRGCSLNGNTARVGGGAYIHNSAATIENSLITANKALQPNPNAVLVGPGGVRDGDGGGLVVDNQDPATITLRGLLLGNNQALRGSGMLTRLARGGTLTLPHFTINSNSGGSAVFALGESNLAFHNSIVALNTGGAAIFAQAGSSGEPASITLDRTLWHPPTQIKTGSSGGGTVNTANDFNGDPALKNDGYHIKRISFAYNAGSNTFNFPDRDGDPRPVGGNADLGADEYASAVTVRYVAPGGSGSAPCDDYRAPCPSLQTALNAANNGDFIKMAGGTYTGVRNDNGRIHHALIAKSVTIEGGYFPRTDNNTVTDALYTVNDWEDPHPVEAPTIIDVNDQGRVFFISGNVAPTLSLLTLRRGNALSLGDGPPDSTGGAGGSVYVDGASPIFKNVLVEDSRAIFGSGFYLRNAGGSYTGVSVLENGTGVSNGRGGGFYIEGGQPTLQGMTLQANVAITGAGIYLDNSAAILIQNTIQNNGDASTRDGGGLFISAGTATLITNTVTNNRAQHGGGLYLQNSNATLRGNSITNNRASANPAPTGQDDGLGGGLYISGGAPLLTANTINGNQALHPALSYGGGLYVAETAMRFITNTVSTNQAQRGGGIYFAGTTNITVHGNTINGNSAQAPNENLRPSGGGIYFAGTTITFTANTVSQNSALFGGGLYLWGTGQSKISQNTLTNNTADKDGGGIYLDGSDAMLEGNTLQANRATGGRGGGLFARNGQASLANNTISGSIAALEGGGIFLSNDGMTLQGDTIQSSQAGDGAGIYIDGPAPGAIQAPPWINRVTLAENTASNHGGGFFLRGSSAHITLNVVRDNQAAVDGGGAYIQESIPGTFSGNLFRDNQAGDQGGGLYITRRSMGRYQSNAIIDNSAIQGGGIFVGGASPTLVHTTLARNGSGLVAMVMDNNPTTVILTNTIVSNHLLGIQGEGGTTVATYATLWHETGSRLFGAGNLSSSNDFEGNPNFQADGYHLAANSAAADKGIKGDAATGNDVDNEGRFQGNGPELGADELTADCAIILANSPNNVFTNLQQAIDAAPANGELRVAGTCTGVQTTGGTAQLALINKSLTIRGGYANGAWETSSPTAHPTVLDAQGLGRVIHVTNNGRVTLANLILINGTASGFGGGPGNADAGGNIFVNNGQITLDRVEVVNGRAALGGGLFLRAPASLVANSTFRSNVASQSGGAIYLDNTSTSVAVRASHFTNNRAADGGAIYAAGGTPIILANTLQNNQTIGGSGRGGGIYLAASNANVNRNRLENNHAGLGGGIYVGGGTPSMTNNMLIRNVGIDNGAALYSINSPLHLRNNTWVANSTVQSEGSALLFAAPAATTPLTLTNNIIVDHSLAISVAEGNQLTIQATLWNNNQTKWLGPASESSTSINQDPQFVNAAAGNYHLLETSPAIDQGINAGVTDDFDGQARPARQGFDIGADEYLRPSVNATLTALPNPVASGAEQTYILRVINNGDVDITARIQLTLPVALTPKATPIWENVLILRGAIWEQTLVATVAPDFTGSLNAVMVVTTSEGATATANATSTAAAISGDILGFSGESLPNPAQPGSSIELSLRIANQGGIPIGVTVRAQLPEGVTSSSPLVYSPTIAGPDGVWSTRLNLHISPDVPTRTPSGDFNELVTTFLIESDQGTSHTFQITTTLAHPGIRVSRIPSPRPAIAGKSLFYTLFVTNTGNVPLATTISNTFPAQVALEDVVQGQPFQTVIPAGEVYQQKITTTVEAGYSGSLVGSVRVTTAQGVSDTAQDQLNAQLQSQTPTATAKGGDWYDPDSWEPPGVPPATAIVLIPENVSLFSNRPIAINGLINRGSLELRTVIGSSQALSLTSFLDNYGEILGRDGVGAGQAGLTLNLNSAILYNEGTICAGDGAPDGGAGGDLIIVAGSTTNKGIFCAGHGADVHNANAGIPGGPGGNVFLSFDPGLFTNHGQVLAGNAGNSHANAIPPQPGSKGGDVTIVAAAAARLNDSDIRAGLGGQGSNGTAGGATGSVIIGAPIINSEGTRFSNGTVLLFDQSNNAYNFTAIGPQMVTVEPVSGLAIFSIRVFNRGARSDTFVASPLNVPTGWTVNNLPATLTLRPFRSNLIFVVLSVPASQVAAAVDELFNVVISSQNDASNQVVVPLRVISPEQGFRIQLPKIHR